MVQRPRRTGDGPERKRNEDGDIPQFEAEASFVLKSSYTSRSQ
jgi:hypothetical protein